MDQSTPDRRPGSPWQQAPGIRSFLKTLWLLHVAPRRLMRSIRVDPLEDRRLLVVGVLLAAFVVVVPIPFISLMTERRVSGGAVAELAITLLGAFWLAAALLMLLSWIERRGVVFFSRSRGWRVPVPLARSIIAHAAVSWFWAWLGMYLSMSIGVPFMSALSRLAAGTFFELLLIPAPVIVGFVLGMLVFEFLVYLGVRECRFANAGTVPATPPVAHVP